MKKHHKILITGNMGYVGPVVEELLCKTMPEITLIGLDCGYFAHCLTGVDFLPETMISQQIFSDVRDITENMLEDVTGVVHLAAISNDPMGKYFEKAESGKDFFWKGFVTVDTQDFFYSTWDVGKTIGIIKRFCELVSKNRVLNHFQRFHINHRLFFLGRI